ncbi:hypothetical protein [Nocardia wallacei]|uniref:hypothetical protein n=1 Tax=Nocardia wallacei TaxID=480035 RepID=UPI002457AFF7|nr:hypothetical protein [Nocardia wallacei]
MDNTQPADPAVNLALRAFLTRMRRHYLTSPDGIAPGIAAAVADSLATAQRTWHQHDDIAGLRTALTAELHRRHQRAERMQHLADNNSHGRGSGIARSYARWRAHHAQAAELLAAIIRALDTEFANHP